MCRRNWFYYDMRVCTELQVLSKTASRLWFYDYNKYKNGNSARRTATQRHIRLYICHGGSDNFSSGISGKLPKIATSNVIFSRTADRIAAKFFMTIRKIKPNNCVHSCSTWTIKLWKVVGNFSPVQDMQFGCLTMQNNNLFGYYSKTSRLHSWVNH